MINQHISGEIRADLVFSVAEKMTLLLSDELGQKGLGINTMEGLAVVELIMQALLTGIGLQNIKSSSVVKKIVEDARDHYRINVIEKAMNAIIDEVDKENAKKKEKR
jgi:hypothetical protein